MLVMIMMTAMMRTWTETGYFHWNIKLQNFKDINSKEK